MSLDIMSIVDLPETSVDRIRTARKRAGITQKDAARKARLSQSIWGQFENGDQDPIAVYRRALAKAEKLYGRECENPSPRCIRAIQAAKEKYQRLERIAEAVGTTAKALLGEE